MEYLNGKEYDVFRNEKNEIIGVRDYNSRYVAYNSEEVKRLNDNIITSKLFAGDLSFNPYGRCEEVYDFANQKYFAYGKWHKMEKDMKKRLTEVYSECYTQKDFDVRAKYYVEDNSGYSLD